MTPRGLEHLQRIPRAWRFALIAFAIAKVAVLTFGLMSHNIGIYAGRHYRSSWMTQVNAAEASHISSHESISMWFEWDGLIYEKLAQTNYLAPLDHATKYAIQHAQNIAHNNPATMRFAFAPLYPLIGKVVGHIFLGNYALAMLAVTNAAFIGLLVLTYKIALLLLGDDEFAERSVKYLVLMPTAFIFQTALSESVFVFFLAASLYCAFTRRWVIAGIAGFCAALTHSTGFAIAVPLGLILLQQNEYRFGRKQWMQYLTRGPLILLPPLGWFCFMVYGRVMTGTWSAYNNTQQILFGTHATNPVTTLWAALQLPANQADRAWIAILALAVIILGHRILQLPLLVYGVIFFGVGFVSPVYGSLEGILRYLLVMFPVVFVFARWGKNRQIDMALTVTLGLLQGVLLMTWVNYWFKYIQ